MSYRVRSYRTADAPAAAALLARLWPAEPELIQRFIDWRFQRNPYPVSRLAVCEHDEGIVAIRGAHGMLWRIGDAAVPMPCVGDTVVDRCHEGRGLVQKTTRWLLAELAGQDVDRVVNQSPGPLVETISLRTGWRKAGEWTVAHALRSPQVAAQGFERLDIAGPVVREGLRIARGPAPPADLAALAASGRRGRIGHVRDEAYFRWRFDNPFADYRWVCAWGDEGRLAGYLVLGRGLQQSWRIRVLDLQGHDGLVQSLLLDQALRWGEFREVRLWWNRFPRRVSAVLAEHGFKQATDRGGRKATHLVAPTRRGADVFTVDGVDLLDLANWDPRMIHSDAT